MNVTAKEQQPSWLATKLIGDELISKIKNLNAQELSWLSGYCVGLLESTDSAGVAVTSPSPVQSTPVATERRVKPVLVVYASQTGNAQSVAELLHQSLSSSGVESVLKSTLDIKVKELVNYSAILMAASTHGEGEPPDDAIELHEALLSKKGAKKRPSLDGIKHAVLGLGDSSYEFFCQTAKDFDKALGDVGSIPLQNPVLCDVDYEESAQEWINQVTESLKDDIGSFSGELFGGAIDTISTENKSAPTGNEYDQNNPFNATIETIQRITGQGSPKETYHLEIDLTDSGIVYEPGDALGVIAHNTAELVREVIELLDLDAGETVQYKGNSIGLEEFLTQKAELTLINKPTVKALLELSPNESLQHLVDNDFGDFIEQHQFVDVLHIVKPTIKAQQLVDILKPIKPRLYSISSSLEECPDEVHLTLNHVTSSNQYGQRYGLASHFLTQGLEEGAEVSIFVEKNPKFKLPLTDDPVIMVGPGTGVAPFRAFLQHREAIESSGKNWLFFGNPHFNTDFLYQVEIQDYLKSGTLSKVDLAFSRDSDKEQKAYVQHKLLDNAAEVWQWLEQGAYFYVCGDMHRMAKDVEAALLTIIKTQGGQDEEQAKQYLKQLKIDNRYQRDIY